MTYRSNYPFGNLDNTQHLVAETITLSVLFGFVLVGQSLLMKCLGWHRQGDYQIRHLAETH